MNHERETNPDQTPDWLEGRGLGPQLKWSFGTDGSLISMTLARETGETFVADSSSTLYRLDRRGQIAALTRLHDPVIGLVWSDDGSAGVGIVGEDTVIRLDRNLQTVHRISVPDVAICVAISPFGNHVAVGMANGNNAVFNERKRRIAQFDTMRPLSFLQFAATDTVLIGAAEHALICGHTLFGALLWQEKNWSNVGALKITGDGDLIYLASFGHGVQTIDGDGAPMGAYVLDGTVNNLAVSFEPYRLIVSSIERHLYWLDADGELLWATTTDDEIIHLACDPLGDWALIGFRDAGLMRLGWDR